MEYDAKNLTKRKKMEYFVYLLSYYNLQGANFELGGRLEKPYFFFSLSHESGFFWVLLIRPSCNNLWVWSCLWIFAFLEARSITKGF